jgi:hypothetical protein
MQTKYPFLSHWKHDGLNEFPSIPFQRIVEHFFSELFEPTTDPPGDREPYLDDDFEIRLRPKFNEITRGVIEAESYKENHIKDLKKVGDDKWKQALKIDISNLIIEESTKAIKADWFKRGIIVGEARKRLLNGADREKILRELGNKVLPGRRGGESLLSGIQIRTLKNVYLEMQEAIKEARRTMDLNVNRPDPDEAKSHEWDHFIKGCPWADTIFERPDFDEILAKTPPNDAAAKIIVRRLRGAVKTNITSGRTLQNKLQNVKPIVRHD